MSSNLKNVGLDITPDTSKKAYLNLSGNNLILSSGDTGNDPILIKQKGNGQEKILNLMDSNGYTHINNLYLDDVSSSVSINEMLANFNDVLDSMRTSTTMYFIATWAGGTYWRRWQSGAKGSAQVSMEKPVCNLTGRYVLNIEGNFNNITVSFGGSRYKTPLSNKEIDLQKGKSLEFKIVDVPTIGTPSSWGSVSYSNNYRVYATLKFQKLI